MEAELRIRELEDEVRRHSALYYAGSPEMTDAQFDSVWAQLQKLELEHPDLVSADSPTQSLFEGAEAAQLFSAAKHDMPMLSLDKSYSQEEVEHWLGGYEGQSLELMPKFDGVSISLSYQGGKLVRAATRGDGSTGEDVTINVEGSNINNLPASIPFKGRAELRGELVMRRSDFVAYNKSNPAKQLANPRNGAAGTLRAKDRDKVAGRILTFMLFEVLAEMEGTIFERAEQLGLSMELYETADSCQQIMDYIQRIAKLRDSLDYEVDGVVVKVADRAVFEAAGATGHHWRGALAYKLAPEEAQTEVEAIQWQVGKSGINAPVLKVKRVFVAGTNIENVSAHNIEMIAKKDIRVGDKIVVVRRGDVIPHAERVVDVSKRSGKEIPIEAPLDCASCGFKLTVVGESRILKCENIAACPAQRNRRLIHWASRDAADIDAVGSVWIEKLAEDGKLAKVSDFYRLDKKTLLGYERMGSTLADKMLASIETSKQVGLRRTLIGWSMPLCSEGTAKRLCRSGYLSVEELMQADSQQLQQVEDIGPLVAEAIVEYLSRQEVKQEVKALRALGVNLDTLPEDGPLQTSSSQLSGKKVVITGTISVPRKDFASQLEAAGALVSGSVSKNTDFLVAGESAGSKLTKAESLGVEVLSEEQAREMIA